jgi:hypothetical protein
MFDIPFFQRRFGLLFYQKCERDLEQTRMSAHDETGGSDSVMVRFRRRGYNAVFEARSKIARHDRSVVLDSRGGGHGLPAGLVRIMMSALLATSDDGDGDGGGGGDERRDAPLDEFARRAILATKDAGRAGECMVCFDEMEDGQLCTMPCMHTLCEGCAAAWFDRGHTCPSCRLDLSSKMTG